MFSSQQIHKTSFYEIEKALTAPWDLFIILNEANKGAAAGGRSGSLAVHKNPANGIHVVGYRLQ